MRKPTCLAEVRDALCGVGAQVETDRRAVVQTKEANNSYGKVNSVCKTYLEACKLVRIVPTGQWHEFLFSDPRAE